MSMVAFGFPRRHYRVTDSTNAWARDLAIGGAPSGTVVTADAQTAGRGRRGRTWQAAPGSALLYSAILRPHSLEAGLPLAVPVAVCDAIESVAPVRCAIKWPNDVWIDERKVAGILIEARIPDWAVIGVGVNVAAAPGDLGRHGDRPASDAAELRWPATSLGPDVGIEALRCALDRALSRRVVATRDEVRAEFHRRDALRGRTVSWQDGGGGTRSGHASGVDADGNLVVRIAGDVRAVLGAGEVSLVVPG